jgi:hypothetical protein
MLQSTLIISTLAVLNGGAYRFFPLEDDTVHGAYSRQYLLQVP